MRKETVVIIAMMTAATAAAAVVWREKVTKERRLKRAKRILHDFAAECATPVPKLWEVANALVADMESATKSINLIVSYVSPPPNEEEKGRLRYGVNLGATKFTIWCGRLCGRNEEISDLKKEDISLPSNVLVATSQELFDYIAAELAKCMAAHDIVDNDGAAETSLGFTVSYDKAAAATSGSAIRWDNFSIHDTVGKSLVKELNETLKKQGLKMRASAIADENVGNLAAGRYFNNDTVAALTLGMRTTATFLNPPHQQVVSMEWSKFKSSSLPITEIDVSLDAESSNPGSHALEKMMSEMYLGEIVRKVLLKMAREAALFGRTVPPKLCTPYLLRSPEMAAMHQDTSEGRQVIGQKLKQVFGIKRSSGKVRELVGEVCEVVAERGARLGGAAIVGIVKKLGRAEHKTSVVVVGGGLYDHYRLFRNYLHNSISDMLADQHNNNILLRNSPLAAPLFL
ncbi:Probable hexokinase-like 2 protein [Linum grandiflorum]